LDVNYNTIGNGPASYEIKEKSHAPKFTFGLKTTGELIQASTHTLPRHLRREQFDNPGPG
jgi:hypothetical protein